MYILSSHNTTKGAKQFYPDEGICLRPLKRRAKLAEISRAWEARKAQERKQAEERAYRRLMADIEREAAARAEKERQAKVLQYLPSDPLNIVSMVAAWHGVTVAEIIGPTKPRHIVPARFDAIAAVKLNCRIVGREYSSTELGKVFGGRDHSSILYALRQRGL